MTESNILKWNVAVLISIAVMSCSAPMYRTVNPTLIDGKYDSEFPYQVSSTYLDQIKESVRMISCVAYYKSYIFPIENKIRVEDINDVSIAVKATKVVFLNRTLSGSATIIYHWEKLLALLTCAHVLTFPDTVITYYRGKDRKPTGFVQSVEIKDRQTNYVGTISGAQNLNILSIDKEMDIAIVGQKLAIQPTFGLPVFNYPLGKAKELEWGTFVYLFGYPSGYRLVTKGIVSDPNRDKYGSFLTDAIFNKGFSGGIVLALRDGVPNFEMVGMVRLVPGHQQYFLTPIKEGETIDLEPDVAYQGDVFVESRAEITYGVTPAIPAESIVEFLKLNEKKLMEKGYDLRKYYEQKLQSN